MAEFGPTSLFDSEMEYNVYDNLNSSSFDSEMEYNVYDNPNGTDFENFQFPVIPNIMETIIFNAFLFTICFLGLSGNGKVIWILGFHMKRNSFSIYVLNLAVADSGVLMMLALIRIFEFFWEIGTKTNFTTFVTVLLLHFMLYNTSQLLLISISVDRCLSVLFPIWHQCRRSPKLSLIVCVIAWVLPFVFFALEMVTGLSKSLVISELIFGALFSYPVVIISTLILLVKIFIKQRQQKRKKVLTATLLALVCFIVLRLPVNIHTIISCYNDLTWGLYDLSSISLLENETMDDTPFDFVYRILPWIQPIIILEMVSNICIAVNSSINPILYFLAGRNKEDRSRVSMKLALRRVFRNEEDAKEDKMQPDETPL